MFFAAFLASSQWVNGYASCTKKTRLCVRGNGRTAMPLARKTLTVRKRYENNHSLGVQMELIEYFFRPWSETAWRKRATTHIVHKAAHCTHRLVGTSRTSCLSITECEREACRPLTPVDGTPNYICLCNPIRRGYQSQRNIQRHFCVKLSINNHIVRLVHTKNILVYTNVSDVPRSLQSWVSTIHTVVLTADVFQLFTSKYKIRQSPRPTYYADSQYQPNPNP